MISPQSVQGSRLLEWLGQSAMNWVEHEASPMCAQTKQIGTTQMIWNLVTTRGEARVGFVTSPDFARDVLGQPKREFTTRSSQFELEYEGLIFRYDEVQRALREVTLVPTEDVAWRIDGHPVEWQKSFMHDVCARARPAEQWVGFVIFRDLGLAFSGFDLEEEEQMAVTLFQPGHWDIFARHFEPYLLPAT